MSRPIPRFAPFILALLAGVALAGASESTALDRYVAAPDPSYSFHEVSSDKGVLCDQHVLEMTSQTWKSEKEVDKPVWKHWLVLHIPRNVTEHTALLMINGGANDKPAPKNRDQTLDLTAVATHTVIADLKGIPSEPLVFTDDHKKRSEDSIIAYTWDKYLKTGDESWPLRLPMTKAAVRAMDTVTAFCKTDAGGRLDIDHFVVTGASKRGWTTWTTAAVDKRVVAIIPIVINTLNLDAQNGRQLAAYGEWSPAIKDYIDIDLPKWTGTPQMHKLMEIEDPFMYRDRYTMPKYMLCATGDQYFMPDNDRFYFDQLPGEKYLCYEPNADHSLRGTDAAQCLLSFYGAFLNHHKMPKLSWSNEGANGIRLKTDQKPLTVKLWQATNAKARDFRLAIIGPAWKSTDLTPDASGEFVGKVETPTPGWTAFMIEATFDNGALPPLKFTTQVRVTPDTLPFLDKLMAK